MNWFIIRQGLMVYCGLLLCISVVGQSKTQVAGKSEFPIYTKTAVLPIYAVKTNLLYGGVALAPNLAVEFGTSTKTSLVLFGAYNPWDGDSETNKKMKHFIVKAEMRYWLCERFNGHFFGVHPFYTEYNVGGHKIPMLFKKEYRYEGFAAGAGLSYGYHWILNHRWSLEATLGAGYAYFEYAKFPCEKCAEKMGNFSKHYFGPTQLGVSLIYIIK
ncbi:MAG: DUF3575 domain-containing protein [Tannerella sp.]|jgi:hypothetical protein|nr:DUF3575 domain-containing protein [Tannerella sp.]